MTATTNPTNPLRPTVYSQLARHVERHKYTKGQYKGSAPADSARRAKSHFRVISVVRNSNPAYAVRFHETDIMTAYEDGTFEFDTAGWHESRTTRDALNHCLHFVRSTGVTCGWVQSAPSQYRIKQTEIVIGGRSLQFFDGMVFDQDGTLHANTPAKPVLKRVADRQERKEWLEDEDTRAFRAALPVIHAGVTAMVGENMVQRRPWFPRPEGIEFIDTSPRGVRRAVETPSKWASLVYALYVDSHAATWSSIYAYATRDMTTDVEVTEE